MWKYLLWILTGILCYLYFINVYANFTSVINSIELKKWYIEEQTRLHLEEEKRKVELNYLQEYSTKVRYYELIIEKEKTYNNWCTRLFKVDLKELRNFETTNILKDETINKFEKLIYKCKVLQKEKIKKRIEEVKKKKVEESKKEEVTDESIKSEYNYSIIQQKKWENTCVIDNLWIIIEYEVWKKINKKEIYNRLDKKIWDFWSTGLYSVNQYWWTFLEINKNELLFKKDTQEYILKSKVKNITSNYKELWEYKDFQKLYSTTNIKTWLTPSIWYMTEILKNHKFGLIEIPMEVLYPNDSKWKNSNIFHAITVIKYDENSNLITYINTLTWKEEKISLDLLKYNKTYLRYPFRYLTWDFNEIDNKIFLN